MVNMYVYIYVYYLEGLPFRYLRMKRSDCGLLFFFLFFFRFGTVRIVIFLVTMKNDANTNVTM